MIQTPTFKRYSTETKLAVLDHYEQQARQIIEGAMAPADGRKLLARVQKIRAEVLRGNSYPHVTGHASAPTNI